MSFVIDTDTCSALLKGNRAVQSRFLQYGGGLFVSAISVAELFTWGHRAANSGVVLQGIDDLLRDVVLLPVDRGVAELFGAVRARMLDRGLVVATPDLLIATTALAHNYTLVSHNARHFSLVPGLRLQDWLTP
jgi:tRNA(fMet)-specific endonuclease VapC